MTTRALLATVVGVVLVLSGTLAGSAGVALMLTTPCSPSYRLAVQSAAVAPEVPDTTVSLSELSDVRRDAVRAAVENRTDVAFADREALATLTDDVILAGGERYVARVVTVPCETPYPGMVFGGVVAVTVGAFLLGYAVLLYRLG